MFCGNTLNYKPLFVPAPLLVMIHHNRPGLTRLAVSSLKAHTSPHHRLMLIDNASGDDLADPAVDIRVNNSAPLSFAANCNQGLAAAAGAPVILLNNDLFLPPGWLEGLLSGLDDGHGIVGAVSNFEVPLDMEINGRRFKLGQRGRPEDLAGQWSEISGLLGAYNRSVRTRPRLIKPNVSFYAVALSAKTLDRIGPLDESFVQGYEDLDYCLRAWEAGFTVVQELDAYVVHFSGLSTPDDREAHMRRDAHNLSRLRENWPPERRCGVLRHWADQGVEQDGRRMWDWIERRIGFLAGRGLLVN